MSNIWKEEEMFQNKGRNVNNLNQTERKSEKRLKLTPENKSYKETGTIIVSSLGARVRRTNTKKNLGSKNIKTNNL